ncbi:hypothetical protein R3W88_031955 [Solanum pinnatisectum]|uniref:TF-B3 domain-containing protein n=1 Tax=Solanum pinnatisectum TaxID=50273 RepID=A0AAV9LNF2_9SOLN|nr:hypothetical protein R3W88_031955 [Solanum pinnatisectum]
MVNKFRRQIGEVSSISNISQPRFCKIIFRFASRYCKNILNPVYLEVPSAEAWEVELEHSEGNIWLAEGWKDFIISEDCEEHEQQSNIVTSKRKAERDEGIADMYFMRNSGNLMLIKVTSFWTIKLKYGDVCVLEVINDTKHSFTIFPGISDGTN